MAEKSKTIKILFFGDIVGKPGRIAARDYLRDYSTDKSFDPKNTFIIANVENASHGFGLTEKNYNELIEYGINCMTSGNHIWDKREIFNYIDNAQYLLRPINYPEGTKGIGSKVFEHNGTKIGVINILGKVFINAVDFQWNLIKEEISKLKKITPIVIVDFHAEATAEKICFAKYCSDLGVSAFLGTHTHVQTADESIINNMGYITDAGFCGSADGVIGMEYQTSLARFLTGIPERYEVAKGSSIQVNAAEIDIDKASGNAINIKRIFDIKSFDKEGKNED